METEYRLSSFAIAFVAVVGKNNATQLKRLIIFGKAILSRVFHSKLSRPVLDHLMQEL